VSTADRSLGLIAMRLGVALARLDVRAQRRELRWGLAAIVFMLSLAVIWLGYAYCHCLFKQYDDAYITFRYAYNLARGNGMVFNVGEPTDSASSFLYTVVLAAVYWLGWHDLPRFSTVLGTLCAAGSCALVYLTCLRRSQRPLLGVFLALSLALDGMISGWAVSGMETLFFTFLISLAAYRMFILGALGWTEAVLVSAIGLTRFEGVLMSAAFGLLALPHLLRGARRRSALQCLCVFGSFGLLLLFKHQRYGTYLPHAFELKQITSLYAPNPDGLWKVWKASALGLLVLAAVGLVSLPRRRQSLAFALYCVASLVSLRYGPAADGARYSVHMLPLAVMLACVPLSILGRELPVLAFVALSVIGYQAFDSFTEMRTGVETGARHQTCRLQIGAYLEQHRPPGPVLSSDIGAIAYAAPSVKFIDAVGLTSSDVLAARDRGESVDAILFAKQPLVLADTCRRGCDRANRFSMQGWLAAESYWRTPLPSYHYGDHLIKGTVLDRCQTPDNLSFAATRFTFSQVAVPSPAPAKERSGTTAP
jgi:hypothetical protein